MTPEKRRNVAYRSRPGACSLRVPILAFDQGDWIEGKIEVPVRLVRTAPHTNERHEFDRLIRENIARWTEWRKRKGWDIASKPRIGGPFDPPSPRTGVEVTDEVKWYFALARFKRTTPLYVGLDDVLETFDAAKKYGIVPEKDPLPWNDVSGTEDTGWIDPLVDAAADREKYGLRLADYRSEELWKAADEGREPDMRLVAGRTP